MRKVWLSIPLILTLLLALEVTGYAASNQVTFNFTNRTNQTQKVVVNSQYDGTHEVTINAHGRATVAFEATAWWLQSTRHRIEVYVYRNGNKNQLTCQRVFFLTNIVHFVSAIEGWEFDSMGGNACNVHSARVVNQRAVADLDIK